MLLDGRLATTTLPSLISLPLVHRRSEGQSGVTKTPRSSPPTEHHPQQRRGVLGFDVFALESTTSSASDIDTGFMSENRKGDAQGPPSSSSQSSSSSSTFTAALGITWHDTDWKTNLQRNLPRGDDQASSQSSSLPTRSQIDHLKVTELKQLCLERGLSRTGNKSMLQDRLWKWSIDQQRNPPVRITKDFLTRYFETSAAEDAGVLLPPPPRKQEEDAVDAIARIFDDSTYTPSSLAEWARNIDLEPLLQKRKEILRQKREGRPAPTTTTTKQPQVASHKTTQDKTSSDHDRNFSTAEYLKSLAKALRAPSLPYSSNIQVKQLYAASKQADQLGERKAAMDLLQTLLMVTPNDARVYRRLARMHTENGDIPSARETLQAGLQQQPENPWLWHGLGQLERTHGSMEVAKEHYQKAIVLDATFAQSYHALGTLEHGQGNVANSMRILKKGLEFCPTNHRLWHAYGDVYREAQMLDDAERSYKRALKHGPPTSHCFAHSSLAAVAYEQGRLDAARRWLFKAIEANNGRHSQGWVALSQLEESVGNIREARLLCTSAIAQYEKGLVDARDRYLEQSGQRHLSPRPTIPDDGPIPLELTAQLLKQVPAYRSGDKFVHVYRNWARLEEQHGDAAAVDRVYERAKMAFPQDSRLMVTWAQYHDRNLNVDRARELYQDACTKAGPRHASPYRILGHFEMSQSNFHEARRILFLGTRAISQTDFMDAVDRKGLPELLLTWAVCEWHLRNMDRAEDLFGHALRLVPPSDSELKSFVLYSIARFKYHRGELLLAQHCVGLALKECLAPSGDGKLWELWANIARDMGNSKLEKDCLDNVALALTPGKTRDEQGDNHGTDSLKTRSQVEEARLVDKPNVEKLMRRDPWQVKLFGSLDSSSGSSYSSSYNQHSFLQALKFPVKKQQGGAVQASN